MASSGFSPPCHRVIMIVWPPKLDSILKSDHPSIHLGHLKHTFARRIFCYSPMTVPTPQIHHGSSITKWQQCGWSPPRNKLVPDSLSAPGFFSRQCLGEKSKDNRSEHLLPPHTPHPPSGCQATQTLIFTGLFTCTSLRYAQRLIVP